MNPTGREVLGALADQFGLQETKNVVAYVDSIYKKFGLARPNFQRISARKAAAKRVENLRPAPTAGRAGRGLVTADRMNSLILGKTNQADLRNAGRDDYWYARTVYQMLIDYSNTPDFDPTKKAIIDEKAREISSCIDVINSSLRDQVLDPSNSASHIRKGNIACGNFFKCMQEILTEVEDGFTRYTNNGKKADLRAKLEQYIENVQNVEPEAAPAAPHEEAAAAAVEELAPHICAPVVLIDAGPDLELLNKLKEAWVSLEGEDVPVEQTARRALMNALLAQKAETLTAPQDQILHALIGSVINARTIDEVTLPDEEETLANIEQVKDVITAQKLLLHRAKQAKELATAYKGLPIVDSEKPKIVASIINSLLAEKVDTLVGNDKDAQRHVTFALANLIASTNPESSIAEFFELLKARKVEKKRNEDKSVEISFGTLASELIEAQFQNAYEIIKKAIGLALYNTIKAEHTELTQLSHALGADLAAAHLTPEAERVVNDHILNANRVLAIVLEKLDHPETLEANQAVTMESLATARREIEAGRHALVQAKELDQENRETARTRVGLILTDLNKLREQIENAKIFQEKRPVLLEQVDAEIRKLNIIQANIDKADTPFDLVEAQAILDEITERQIPAIRKNLAAAEHEAQQAKEQLIANRATVTQKLDAVKEKINNLPKNDAYNTIFDNASTALATAADLLNQANRLIDINFFDGLNIAKVETINDLLNRANVALDDADEVANREPEHYRYRVSDFVDLQGDKEQLEAAIEIVYGTDPRARNDLPFMYLAATHIVQTFVSDRPDLITVTPEIAAKQLEKRNPEDLTQKTDIKLNDEISESHALAQLIDKVDEFAIEWNAQTKAHNNAVAIHNELDKAVATEASPLNVIKKTYDDITAILHAVEPKATITLLDKDPAKSFAAFKVKKNAKVLFLGEHSILEAFAYNTTYRLRSRVMEVLPGILNGLALNANPTVGDVLEALIKFHYVARKFTTHYQFTLLSDILKQEIITISRKVGANPGLKADLDIFTSHWIGLRNAAIAANGPVQNSVVNMTTFDKGLEPLVAELDTRKAALEAKPAQKKVLDTIFSGTVASLEHAEAPVPDEEVDLDEAEEEEAAAGDDAADDAAPAPDTDPALRPEPD